MISVSRRQFLGTMGKTAAVASAIPLFNQRSVHAGESGLINIALIGCGGRGRGAAIDALSTQGPTKLIAIGDIFEQRVSATAEALTAVLPDQVDLPAERQFCGFDAYKNAIDLLRPGDVVLLASCPVFRPLHVEYAVEKGINVFMEKPFATDSPGTRRIQAAARKADEKNIKVACGLMWRHCKAREELVDRVRNGEIGDIISMRGFRMHEFLGPRKYDHESELAYQLRAFHEFDWSGANAFIDFCIHNIDNACWAKDAWPVSCIGLGGRSKPDLPGQIFDSYYHEFTFADGSHLTSHGLYPPGCFNQYSDYLHGTKGSAVLMDNLGGAKCRIYGNQAMKPGTELWAFEGPEPNPYQIEQDRFFHAIRNDIPYNEGHRAADANFASLLGRAATYSGQIVTWDQVVASNRSLFDIDNITWDSAPPILPDEQGIYPYAIPGITDIL